MLPEALVDLAIRPWGRPRRGLLVHRTAERILELQPSFPIPGPNQAGRVRCAPDRVAPMVDETRELAASYRLRCMWCLDPDARPLDLADRLAACGMVPAGEVAVMVLPSAAALPPGAAPVEIVDALGDAATFAAAEAVQAAAFGDGPAPGQAERFREGRDEPTRHFFLALLNGQPAGAAWATVHDEGVTMNGGAVAPRFQGRGIYRALVAERLALARRVGAPGVGTWARPDTSAPLLARWGFREVGRNRLYQDTRA